MNKVMITIGLLSGINCQTDGTSYELPEKAHWNHLVTNIQDMKEWMKQDIYNDNIITDLGEFYIENLNEVEDMLIEISNTN